MARGFTLLELTIVLLIAGFMLAVAVRPTRRVLDHYAADAAARDVTTLLATARHTAIAWGCRTRLQLGRDSLTIDTLGAGGWGRYRWWPGPATGGVALWTNNPVVTFGPNGVGWGVSNTSVRLSRGSHVETVIVSRLGRVRRG